jgi:hypothetical protein
VLITMVLDCKFQFGAIHIKLKRVVFFCSEAWDADFVKAVASEFLGNKSG